MSTRDIPQRTSKTPLQSPQVQYPDGTVVTPSPLDVEGILEGLERLNKIDRAAFLCVIAHSLTVDIRALLLDRPVSDQDLARIKKINEFLHQLTSCANPHQRRSASGDAELVRAIIDTSYRYGLEAAIGRALATAARNARPSSSKLLHAGIRSMSSDDLPPYPDVEKELLLLLFRSGGSKFSRKADEVYSPLADVFGLTQEQRTRLHPDREESAWNNRVQWARRKLVDSGLIFRGPRGVWRLTEIGRRQAEAIAHQRC